MHLHPGVLAVTHAYKSTASASPAPAHARVHRRPILTRSKMPMCGRGGVFGTSSPPRGGQQE
eukprot:6872349-Lingulodinium_polyedra.AAC.1